MALTIEEIGKATHGEWLHLRGHNLVLTGACITVAYMQRGQNGNLYFALSPKGKKGTLSRDGYRRLDEAFRVGAAAAVVPIRAKRVPNDKPLLVVDDTRQALERLAIYSRDRFEGKCVLVTGTEGKTGYKCYLHHVVSQQASAHAILNSSNLTAPIWVSLVSIRQGDEFEIIEASVPQPRRGTERSRFVRPHICVITEVGNEHLNTHGSMENLIKHKASIVDGTVDGGLCILNADNEHFPQLCEQIVKRRQVQIVTFGSTRECNASVTQASFARSGWNVQGIVEGTKVEYFVPMIWEHVPTATISVLLTVSHLGLDVQRAAADFRSFQPFETMGVILRIPYQGKEIVLLDQSQRVSTFSYRSSLKTVARLYADPGGRKIGVLGHMPKIAEMTHSVHEELAQWVEEACFDRIYAVGEHMTITLNRMSDTSMLARHADSWEKIEDDVLNDIRGGDLIFVKGHLSELGERIRNIGEKTSHNSLDAAE